MIRSMLYTMAAPRRRAAVLSCAVLLLTAPARAQDVDPQKEIPAQALYEEAIADMEVGNHEKACRKLEEAARLVPDAIGARLVLADCYEHLGKFASAWSQFAIVESMAARAGQSERAAKAAARATALRQRLATLTIDVAEPLKKLPSLSISRDGAEIGSAQWGVAVPVDTGKHRIIVSAPGYRAWEKDVDIAVDGASVAVSVGPLERARAPLPLPAALPQPPPPPPSEPTWDRTWQRPVGIAAIAAGGTGIVGGAAAAAFAGAASEGSSGGASDAWNAAFAAFLVGGAVTVGGVVLVVIAPPRDPPDRRAAVSLGFSARMGLLPGGLQLAGQW